MSPEKLTRMQADIRRDFKALAKIYPACFDAKGKPTVAVLRLPYTQHGSISNKIKDYL